MSKDKHKSLARRLRLLRKAASRENGIMFHRAGGMAMSNRDVQRLVADGHLQFVRRTYNGRTLSPKRFWKGFRRDHNIDQQPDGSWYAFGVTGRPNVTRGVITEKGREFLESQERRR